MGGGGGGVISAGVLAVLRREEKPGNGSSELWQDKCDVASIGAQKKSTEEKASAIQQS